MTEERFDLQGLAIGQVWQHKKGDIYEIYDFTNLSAGRQDEFPTRVSYRNIVTGEPHSRDVVRWAGSFTRRQDLEGIQVAAPTFDVELHFTAPGERGAQKYTTSIVAVDAPFAISIAKEQLLKAFPEAKFSWVNAVGQPIAKLRSV